MSLIIKEGSYCPVCGGIVLADCKHSMHSIRSAVRPVTNIVTNYKLVKELRDALVFFNSHPKTMQDSKGYEEIKAKADTYLERDKTCQW